MHDTPTTITVYDRLEVAFGKEKAAKVGQLALKIPNVAQREEWLETLIQTVVSKSQAPVDDLLKWRYKPVPIRVFIESPYYLDKAGTVYPKILDELEEINSGRYVETVFTGGIGSGKTTGALYTLAYQTYVLSCLRSPHAVFGLDPSSEILIVFQSLNARLAKALDYNRFKSMIDGSMYFREHFPYDKNVESQLNFPHRISVVPLTGQETAAIGQNVIGGLLDELNYMAVVENSKASLEGETFNQALALYNSIARRRKSRFVSAGNLPGMLCLVSSKRYPGQFTDLKEEEAKTNKAIYIYDKRVWDVKPAGSFKAERFRVFIGDEGRKPRILEDHEVVPPEDADLVDYIPEDFREDFESDIINSLREIAGKSTLSTHPFILNTEAITRCMSRPSEDSVFGSEWVDFVQQKLLLYPDLLRDPHLPRAAHIDLGITGDSAGLTIGTITGFRAVTREAGAVVETLPEYWIDGMLEIRPPKGGEILFWRIRNAILKLRDLGLNIRWVSLDSFQSRDTLQILRAKGFVTGLLSIDVTMLPYENLKTALYDGRVSMATHAKCRKELASLEKNARKGKVDHPQVAGGSKDVSDSLAGVCYTLLQRRELWAAHKVPLKEMPAVLLPDNLHGESAPQAAGTATSKTTKTGKSKVQPSFSAEEQVEWSKFSKGGPGGIGG